MERAKRERMEKRKTEMAEKKAAAMGGEHLLKSIHLASTSATRGSMGGLVCLTNWCMGGVGLFAAVEPAAEGGAPELEGSVVSDLSRLVS
jgi:hypothetical protein